jgi:hypothetical protein
MKSQLLKCLLLVLITALLTFFITCYFCKKLGADGPDITRSITSICSDYDTQVPPTLTSKMVKSMVGQYTAAQLNNIQTATTNAVPQDAKSIWFDLETLKKFLYHIEHNTGKHYSESKDKSMGVRIYYAAYPEDVKMKLLAAQQTDPNFTYNPNYEKLHTLVMIPTISGANGENYDFNPLDVNSFVGFTNMKKDGKSYIEDDYPTLTLGTSAPNVTISAPTPSHINAQNHGRLCPPSCNGANAF